MCGTVLFLPQAIDKNIIKLMSIGCAIVLSGDLNVAKLQSYFHKRE